MSAETEKWAAIEGFPGYEVSDHGRVRSYRRPAGLPDGHAPRVLTPYLSRGYPRICLIAADGRKRNQFVHRLVAASFIGDPTGWEVAHNDGNPANCHVDNLRLATHMENELDKERHGTRPRGEMCKHAKLTEQQVREILARLAAGETAVSLSAVYGVRANFISRIKSGEAWGHIPREVAA